MKYTFEDPKGLNQRVRFEIPAQELQEKIDLEVKKMTPQLSLKGFRKGKAPKDAVLTNFQEQILGRILNESSQTAFQKLLDEASIHPAASPSLEVQTLELGKDFCFFVIYDTFPKFKTPELKDVKVEKIVSSVSKEDIEAAVKELLKTKATYQEVSSRAVQKEDRVGIDFKGFIKGESEPFEGGSAEGHQLTIGEGRFIPGFEDGVIGMKLQETKNIELTFPEDYEHEGLKGKEVIFEVKLNKIESPVLPELNEDFFKQFVKKGEPTLENFEADLEGQLKRELERHLENKNREAAYKALKKAIQIPLPESLIQEEIKRLRDQMQNYFKQQNGGQEIAELPLDAFKEEGEDRVHLSLVVRQFIEDEKIEPNDDEVDAFIRERALDYDKPESFFQHYKSDKGRHQGMKDRLIEKIVLERLFAQMDVEEKKEPFKNMRSKR